MKYIIFLFLLFLLSCKVSQKSIIVHKYQTNDTVLFRQDSVKAVIVSQDSNYVRYWIKLEILNRNGLEEYLYVNESEIK